MDYNIMKDSIDPQKGTNTKPHGIENHERVPDVISRSQTASPQGEAKREKSLGTHILFRNVSSSEKSHVNTPSICKNCLTSTTPLWRRDENGAVLCNACGLFLKLHGRPRPISLKTDTIKSRNRKGNANHEQSEARNLMELEPKNLTKYDDKKRKHKENGSNKDSITSTKKTKLNEESSLQISSANTTNNVMHNNQNGSTKILNSVQTNERPKQNDASLIQTKTKTQLPGVSTLLSDIGNTTTKVTKSFDKIKQATEHKNNIFAPVALSSNSTECQSSHPNITTATTATTLTTHFHSTASPHITPRNSGPLSLTSLKDTFNMDSYYESSSQHPHTHNSEVPSLNESPSIHPVRSAGSDNLPNSSKIGLRNVVTSSNASSSNAHSDQISFKSDPISLENENRKTEGVKPPEETESQLSITLKNEEEIIRLKTRINELELVTDLYKKHIFELDKKYRELKKQLNQ
ncbi:hypothetical protein C6P45_002508 [Maudiozyma exigua]|uniref:GATA-type domain-containing protein n=1 Tax=Maudiozyma exigua TaxID=34358 RepID=A0A9P7B409_MAUEX|nr:hypothetical protein C6P45_002508 [Kazachstania exigua]